MPTREDQKILASLNRDSSPGFRGTYLGYIFVLRLFLGAKFFQMGQDHLNHPGPLRALLHEWMTNPNHAFWVYQDFLRQIVMTHFSGFHVLLAVSEIAIGIALLLGLLTRVSALVALLISLNFWLASGLASSITASLCETLAVVEFIVLCAGPGRWLGLDSFLARRFPRAPFW